MNNPGLPSPSRITPTIEISAAATLGVTAIVLLAIYLTRTDIDPHPGNVILTAAGVSAVLAVVLIIHNDLRQRLDNTSHELRYLRCYTMLDRAESIESDTNNITDITKHRDR